MVCLQNSARRVAIKLSENHSFSTSWALWVLAIRYSLALSPCRVR